MIGAFRKAQKKKGNYRIPPPLWEANKYVLALDVIGTAPSRRGVLNWNICGAVATGSWSVKEALAVLHYNAAQCAPLVRLFGPGVCSG